jgi:hypothetical protein
MACIRALKWVRENAPWQSVTRVQVFTDSQYVKDNLFRAREWKKNDWKNRHGDTNGTRSIREASAQRACTNGLKPSVFLAADGRRILIGMSSHRTHASYRRLVKSPAIQSRTKVRQFP